MVKAQSRKVLSTHIFFFFLFLVVPILVSSRPPGEPFLTVTRPFIQDVVANILYLGFFYLNYYVLVPKLYFQHKYIVYGGYALLCLAVILVLPYLVITQMHGVVLEPPPHDAPNALHDASHSLHERPALFFVFDELRRHLYQFFTAIFFSFLLRTREHLNEIKEEKFEAEITSLKSQINPHFLFNTLNSIYILSLKKDDRASDAIINLSGIMRYAIKDARDAKIALHKELDYIRNYIELQAARFGNTATIVFECVGEAGNMEISPLLLITYIENAFKYGINPDLSDCMVTINLQINPKGLTLHTFNKKVQLSPHADATGIGLKNTKDRLEYFYPKKHKLDIVENDEIYSVTLSIELV